MVHLHLSILISLTTNIYSQSIHLLHHWKSQNYFTWCPANHHHLILSRHLCWNRARILSLFSLHIWLIYLSPKVFFHQNSSWHKSHLFWRSLGSPNLILQISGLSPIWTLLAKYWNAWLWLASFLIFPFLPVFHPFSRHIESSILQKQLCSNWLMISWTPLIQERSQFLLLSICRLLLTLWTILPFFIGLNIHLVCQELSTPGFTHT